MTHPISLSNAIVMNKYIWMCRQLRNFNDTISIVNWANATLHVKALLLDDEHASQAHLHSSTTINQQSYDPDCSITSPTTICFQPTPNQRPSATYIQQGNDPHRSLTPPTKISFQPTPKKPLTKSPARYSYYVLSRPTPLTIYPHCQSTIPPSDSLPPCPKRRKIKSIYRRIKEFS